MFRPLKKLRLSIIFKEWKEKRRGITGCMDCVFDEGITRISGEGDRGAGEQKLKYNFYTISPFFRHKKVFLFYRHFFMM